MKASYIDFYKLNFYEIPGDLMVGSKSGAEFSDEATRYMISFVFLRKLGKAALGPGNKNGATLVPLKDRSLKPISLDVRKFGRSGVTLYVPRESAKSDFFLFESAGRGGKPFIVNGFRPLGRLERRGEFEEWIEMPVFTDSEGRWVYALSDEKIEFLENVAVPDNFSSAFYVENGNGARIFAAKKEYRRHILYFGGENGEKMEKVADGADAVFSRGKHLFVLTRTKRGTKVAVYDLKSGKKRVGVSFSDIAGVYDALYDEMRKTLYLFSIGDSPSPSLSYFCTAIHVPTGKRERFDTGLPFIDGNPVATHLFNRGENGEVFIWYGFGDENGETRVYGRKVFDDEGEILEIPVEKAPIRVVGIGNGRGARYRPVYGVNGENEIVVFDERGNVKSTGASLKGGVLYDEILPDGDLALILSTGDGSVKAVREGKTVDIEGDFKERRAYPVMIPDPEGEDLYGAVLKRKRGDLLLIFPKREEGGGIAYAEIPSLSADFVGVRASFATERIGEGRRIVTLAIGEAEINEIVTLMYDSRTGDLCRTDRFWEKNDMGDSIHPLGARLIKTERRKRSLGISGSEKRNVSYIHVSKEGRIHARDRFLVNGERSNVSVFLFERKGERYYAVKTHAEEKEGIARILVEIEGRPSEERLILEIPIWKEDPFLFETLKGNPETIWSLITQDGNNLDSLKESVEYMIETRSSGEEREAGKKEIEWSAR